MADDQRAGDVHPRDDHDHVQRAAKWLVGLVAIVGLIARLVVMERRAIEDARDWQRIAENYRWKLDDHGKGWCQ